MEEGAFTMFVTLRADVEEGAAVISCSEFDVVMSVRERLLVDEEVGRENKRMTATVRPPEQKGQRTGSWFPFDQHALHARLAFFEVCRLVVTIG